MGPKTSKAKNSRRWSPVEIDTFADVLADAENNYAIALDKLTLKKSSNNEVFEHVRSTFVAEMEKEDFRVRNKEHFIRTPSKLDTSIEKLRQKYKWLKNNWADHTRRAKNGSGLAPDEEPHWYQILNPVFAETHEPLNLVASATDTSFVAGDGSSSDIWDSDNSDDEDPPPESPGESEQIGLAASDREILQGDSDAEADNIPDDKQPPKKKLKVVRPAHKKAERIKSTAHGLAAIARGIQSSIAAQDKRFDRQLKESAEREKRLLEFRASEAEKDRKHEERMAQLMVSMRTTQPQFSNSQSFPTWGVDNQSGSFVSPTRQQSWNGMSNDSFKSPIASGKAGCSSYNSPLNDPYQPFNNELPKY